MQFVRLTYLGSHIYSMNMEAGIKGGGVGCSFTIVHLGHQSVTVISTRCIKVHWDEAKEALTVSAEGSSTNKSHLSAIELLRKPCSTLIYTPYVAVIYVNK